MRKIVIVSSLLALTLFANAQDSVRILKAVRSELPIKIDGHPNEEAWLQAPLITRFVEQRPSFGRSEDTATRTEMRILYDDNAVYISGFCHETARDSISTELVGRDVIGINDFAGVMFDTYRDQINGVGFYVTALGEQYDCKYSLNNEDDGWSTVYQTATKLLNNGWTFEMRIPYSALRFSKEKVQSWGVNFVRRRTKTGKQFMWNPVDPNKFGMMNQTGIWEGISDIKSPVRLSLSPYFATYASRTPDGKWDNSVNGGMDVKYGISKGFTLDMTLIPDFGQVQSDNQVLNLSPFEVRYNEYRSFFTEGTELFNKGNLFYSRRIGGVPLNRNFSVPTGETITENPSETKLINATKVSGRTSHGLGIGFFNAITKPQHAKVTRANGEEYEVETNPLTNYNIMVLDQTMKNNSSVTLVNTNVTRNGSAYDANVTAGLWDLYDKKVDWNFWGKVGTSTLTHYTAQKTNLTGYLYELNFGKFRGPFNFEIHQHMADDQYQQNDMGYFTNNNFVSRGFFGWYKWNTPHGFYNNFRINFGGEHTERYRPKAYQSLNFNLNVNTQLKNLWQTGINMNLRPRQNDFYEPRIDGKVFKRPSSWMSGFFLNTNSAKKYSAGVSLYYRRYESYKGNFKESNIFNRYRFNDRLTLNLSHYLLFGENNPGFAYVENPTGDVVFGLRHQRTAENVLSVKYNFNIKMGITFRARHYWSKVEYTEFFNLMENGGLSPKAQPSTNPNNNVNFFNIDMVYTWQFAQGSFLNVGWKDAAESFDQTVGRRYYYNLDRTLGTPQLHSFSIKLIYFLDYLSLKKNHRKL